MLSETKQGPQGSRCPETADIIVVGGGPAGLVAALLLARQGRRIAILRPEVHEAPEYARTTALLAPSVDLISHLGAWTALSAAAAPLQKMRLIDDRNALLRAPTIVFNCAELGLEQFGFNIPNAVLNRALEEQAKSTPSIAFHDGEATAITPEPEQVVVTLADGRQFAARLVIGADGRKSLARKASGVRTGSWAYLQSALTLNLTHSADHRFISTEFHTASGPFTLVPLPGRASSLVAVVTPADGAHLMSLSREALSDELTKRSHHVLGRLQVASRPALFPLGGHIVQNFAGKRIALVGDAAHGVPPIGAQGLNLGLRDGAHLADAIARSRDQGGDPGSPDVLAAYNASRRADVWSRTAIIDLVNRSLLAGMLPFDALRGVVLSAARDIAPLRRLMMRTGIAPGNFAAVLARLGIEPSVESAARSA